jgi:hypothetical protein
VFLRSGPRLDPSVLDQVTHESRKCRAACQGFS